MLNEKRIKLMVKLASYEAKEGKEDLKISSYYRKDYTSFHVLYTLLWVTVGYVIAAGVIILVEMERLLENMTMHSMIMILAGVAAGYIAVLILYGLAAYYLYRKKHNQARQRVRQYNHDLIVLNKMYEKENG